MPCITAAHQEVSIVEKWLRPMMARREARRDLFPADPLLSLSSLSSLRASSLFPTSITTPLVGGNLFPGAAPFFSTAFFPAPTALRFSYHLRSLLLPALLAHPSGAQPCFQRPVFRG
jgi:hypothetical protein